MFGQVPWNSPQGRLDFYLAVLVKNLVVQNEDSHVTKHTDHDDDHDDHDDGDDGDDDDDDDDDSCGNDGDDSDKSCVGSEPCLQAGMCYSWRYQAGSKDQAGS